jgi:peptidoglycan/xylan/chitin deacetylase (PgdA/CDA1 family)
MSEPMRVALTFDAEHPDRPNDGDRTPIILETLADAGARATFFLQGRWVEAFPELAQAIAAGEHLIGNHSHYHARLPLFSDEGLPQDVRDSEAVIRATTGHDPRPWFRAPFGSGADRADLVSALAGLRYRHVGWHVECYEWEPERTADEVLRSAVDGTLAHGDGAIVLLHTWPRPVAPALPAILRELGEAGYSFVGVDELDLPDGLAPIAEPRPSDADAVGVR